MAIVYYPLYIADSTVTDPDTSPGVSGLTPVFLSLKTTGASPGVDVSSSATISEVGGGQYQVAYDPEANGEAAGVVDAGSTLTVNTDRFVPVGLARDSSYVAGLAALRSEVGVVVSATTGGVVVSGLNGQPGDYATTPPSIRVVIPPTASAPGIDRLIATATPSGSNLALGYASPTAAVAAAGALAFIV